MLGVHDCQLYIDVLYDHIITYVYVFIILAQWTILYVHYTNTIEHIGSIYKFHLNTI